MAVQVARLRLKFSRGGTEIQTSKRNPRGVHYMVGRVQVSSAGLSKEEFRAARQAAIKRLVEGTTE